MIDPLMIVDASRIGKQVINIRLKQTNLTLEPHGKKLSGCGRDYFERGGSVDIKSRAGDDQSAIALPDLLAQQNHSGSHNAIDWRLLRQPLLALTSISTVDFLAYSQQVVPHINESLARATEYRPGCPARLKEAIRHSLLAPGKRLRPMLVLMAAESCGCQRSRAMPAALAVEMVHTYSLIHDDLPAMDDDDLRRGQPSCHAAYGEATAILAGDALLAQAFETLATGLTPASVAARCCAELAAAAGASELVGGQADDLDAAFVPQSLDELELIHCRKTGAMFRVSLRLGGLVAGAEPLRLDALDAYGRHLGLAFQIIDDLLDVKGNAAELGKRTGKDSHRGKATFPTILGIDESRRRAQRLIEQACGALAPLGEAAAPLNSLARFVLERNR